MCRAKLGVLIAIPSLFALTPHGMVAADAACPARIGIEATVAPVEGREGEFRLRAETKDLATGNLLPSPQVFFRQGGEASANSTLPGNGEIRFVVSVEGSATVFKVEARCGGELTTSQKVTVQLPK